MNITFTGLDFSGAPDDNDTAAAELAVAAENARLQQAGDPLLPVDTPANLKASYLSILLTEVNNQHARNARSAADADARSAGLRNAWRNASDAERDQIKAILNI